ATPQSGDSYENLVGTPVANIVKPCYNLEANENCLPYLHWFGVSKSGDAEAVIHTKLFKFGLKSAASNPYVKIQEGAIITNDKVTLLVFPAIPKGDAANPGKINLSCSPSMNLNVTTLDYVTTDPDVVSISGYQLRMPNGDPAEEGRLSVYAQFQSPFGETTEVVSASTIYDKTTPTASLYRIGDSEGADYNSGSYTNTSYSGNEKGSVEVSLDYKNSLIMAKFNNDATLWGNPAGIAADSNAVYVADSTKKMIYKLDSLTLVKISQKSGLDMPYGLEADEKYLYVSDKSKNVVYKLDKSSMAVVASFGVYGAVGSDDSHLSAPEDIAVDGCGNYVYVNDKGNNRIVKLAASGLSYVAGKKYGSPDYGFTNFDTVSGIAANDTSIFLSNEGGHIVGKFDESLTNPSNTALFGEYNTAASNETHLNVPKMLGQSADFIYVADSANKRIVRLTHELKYVSSYGGFDFGALNGPLAVCGYKDRIYISDTVNKRVIMAIKVNDEYRVISNLGAADGTISPAGQNKSDNPFRVNEPGSIVSDRDYSYFTDKKNHRVLKIKNDTLLMERQFGVVGAPGSDNSHLNLPSGVCTDTDSVHVAEYIYVADSVNMRILKLKNKFSGFVYSAAASVPAGAEPQGMCVDYNVSPPRLYVADKTKILVYDTKTMSQLADITNIDGALTDAIDIKMLSLDSTTKYFYIVDKGKNQLFRVKVAIGSNL
ncbi:MAG TPA: NHL repeat-containing protein, partial [Candidatus Wallbacteria bacterium]|nr:NHL repeat-containing protein [Candidatus Wallbacteria bacterium]